MDQSAKRCSGTNDSESIQYSKMHEL